MIINSLPNPSFGVIKNSKILEFGSNYKFYSLGRFALLNALIDLGVRKGDVILVPAYICSSSISPLEHYGYIIKYVDLDNRLNMNTNKIDLLLLKFDIKAILVVYFFGYENNFNELKHKYGNKGIRLIQDYSHSLFNEFLEESSENYDAKIFSFRKNLPVDGGGLLKMENTVSSGIVNEPSTLFTLRQISTFIVKKFILMFAIFFNVNIYSDSIRKIEFKKNNQNTSQNKYSLWCNKKYLSSKNYLYQSRKTIIKNYSRISSACSQLGIEVFKKELKSSEVPQAIAIIDKTRDLEKFLKNSGIGAWRWPENELPEEVKKNRKLYPNSNKFNDCLILLPVHQSLKKHHIDYMIKILQKWLS